MHRDETHPDQENPDQKHQKHPSGRHPDESRGDAAPDSGAGDQPVETYSPWTVVNLVFHHLADEGLHPTLGGPEDPGRHAAALLRCLGIAPTAEGDTRIARNVRDELADLRAAIFGDR